MLNFDDSCSHAGQPPLYRCAILTRHAAFHNADLLPLLHRSRRQSMLIFPPADDELRLSNAAASREKILFDTYRDNISFFIFFRHASYRR